MPTRIVLWITIGVLLTIALACAGGSAPSRISETACWSRRMSPVSGDFMPGEVIVVFTDGTSLAKARKFLEGYDLTLLKESSFWEAGNRSILVCVDPGREAEWIERLGAGRLVEYAQLNGIGWVQTGG